MKSYLKRSFLLFILLFLFNSARAYAYTNESLSHEVTISATVGEPKLTLFGYTSPHALVELRGQQVLEEVVAQENGYFFFDQIILPLLFPRYPELCLNAIDTHSRSSFPICLPPLPEGPYVITIGPVLLPPTVSLEKGQFSPQEQVAAQGETIPNTQVTVYLYSTDWSPGKLSLVTPALAYSIPQYHLQANSTGRFEFNLPANRPNHWRVYATAQFLDSPTPKSNTLNFKVLSWWEWLWLKLKAVLFALMGLFRPYFWFIIIALEVVILSYLFWRGKKSTKTNFRSLR